MEERTPLLLLSSSVSLHHQQRTIQQQKRFIGIYFFYLTLVVIVILIVLLALTGQTNGLDDVFQQLQQQQQQHYVSRRHDETTLTTSTSYYSKVTTTISILLSYRWDIITNTATTTTTHSSDHVVPLLMIQQQQTAYDEEQEEDLQDEECIYQYPSPMINSPDVVVVEQNRIGFPSFWNYYNDYNSTSNTIKKCITKAMLRPIQVSYNQLSILINQQPVLLLGGSIHVTRVSQNTFLQALETAVQQGLNVITMYIIWSTHQKYMNEPFSFIIQYNNHINVTYNTNKKKHDWDIQRAIREIANRGLFVHIRIGPYICGEYNYGGIPEWIPILYNNNSTTSLSMRRYNPIWLSIMKEYVTMIVQYLQDHSLFAYQGGPIILAQIENEIGNDDSTDIDDNVDNNNNNKKKNRSNELLQQYADWCGNIVQELAPNVTWTMCTGYVANNTIETYNGFFDDTSYLDTYGNTKRIQINQPALWTEHEGGFQIWGEEPYHPVDYVWGITARQMTFTTIRWIARGGSHINYYMWLGGYNLGRGAAAGIMNQYANEAPVCSSGQKHYPKYLHLKSLLYTLQQLAPILLSVPSSLHQEKRLFVQNSNSNSDTTTTSWVISDEVVMFVYQLYNDTVLFVENSSNTSYNVKIPLKLKDTTINYMSPNQEILIRSLQPYSAIVVLNNVVLFDSAYIPETYKSFVRKMDYTSSTIIETSDWTYWLEPIGVPPFNDSLLSSITNNYPIEQTILNTKAKVYSDYAWYETNFVMHSIEQSKNISPLTLVVDTRESNAFIVYIDGIYVGSIDTHDRLERDVHLSINITPFISFGKNHTISFLSESLGYSNLIGRWRSNTRAKTKGITGNVTIVTEYRNYSLTDRFSIWRMFPGLYGERYGLQFLIDEEVTFREEKFLSTELLDRNLVRSSSEIVSGRTQGTWSSVIFRVNKYDSRKKGLFLDITSGRGHVWVNGYDLGRYWNITKGNVNQNYDIVNIPGSRTIYSQQYYFVPYDYLRSSKNRSGSSGWNELILFNAMGHHNDTNCQIVSSWMEKIPDHDTPSPLLRDEIDYMNACI